MPEVEKSMDTPKYDQKPSAFSNALETFRGMTVLEKIGALVGLAAATAALLNISSGIVMTHGFIEKFLASYREIVTKPILSAIFAHLDLAVSETQFDLLVLFSVFYWCIARAAKASGYLTAFKMEQNSVIGWVVLYAAITFGYFYFPTFGRWFVIGLICYWMLGMLASLFDHDGKLEEIQNEPGYPEDLKERELKRLIYGRMAMHYSITYLIVLAVIVIAIHGVNQGFEKLGG